ncbi:hypothetical protein [Acinetobacter baylyi]|uniref:hypothetical protein n=1 Tax=Acinetobacter baylyi TaxID=202950 RepID=UPI0031D630D3
MAKNNTQPIDIASNFYWYECTFNYLKKNHGIETDEDFSDFFHENLEFVSGDSKYFSKIKSGRTTLGRLWLSRIEKKLPSSLEYYTHFIWDILIRPPSNALEVNAYLEKVPKYLRDHILPEVGKNLSSDVNHNNFIQVRNYYNLDSLGFLILLHINARYFSNTEVVNFTHSLIYETMEPLSILDGLERAHIFIFYKLQYIVNRIIIDGFNNRIEETLMWSPTRENWKPENREKSIETESKMFSSEHLRLYLIQSFYDFSSISITDNKLEDGKVFGLL